MDVIVTNLQGAQVDVGFVRDVLVQALRLQGYRHPPDVGVALVDDGYIRVLNREYRGGDYATDVLAFPIDPDDGAPASSQAGEATLGDIVISVERAREQARQFKHPLRREVALLAIHGLLHLLGYDDETEAAASVMWARQKELLETILGEGAPSPRARPARDLGR
ncbi:MAG TPA: rRNA maturation RNase YbeY [bacterium]|nr:rRNA maturation RNase YbeY [bacterium]